MRLFKHIKNDFPASIVVFFVALPLCLGIALASGAPLFSGLIAGIVGGIVVSSVSRSALGVSGPAAGLSVIVLNAIGDLGFEVFLVSVVIAGILQIIMGVFKGGYIANYFPSSVIKGMLSGIGIIIFWDQVPQAFGYTGEGSIFSGLNNVLAYISYPAIVVSAISLAILITWGKLSTKHSFFRFVPGPVVAVIFGMSFQMVTVEFFPGFLLSPELLVSVPMANGVSEFFGQFTLPDARGIMNPAVWIAAFTIAIVASLETLLCVEAADKLDPDKRTTPPNRELIAQGTGNILSGLIGGLPITQVIVRSSTNIMSNGKTKLSAIFHGIFLLLSVILIPKYLNHIPLAVLAAILFTVGYKLARPALFKAMYKLGWAQFAPFLITVAGIVFTDLLIGISIGLALAFFIILRNSQKNSHSLNVQEHENGPPKLKMTLPEHVTFLNKGPIIRALQDLPKNSEVIIDLSNSKLVDYDILEIIRNFKETAREKNIRFNLNTPERLLTANK